MQLNFYFIKKKNERMKRIAINIAEHKFIQNH